MKKLIAYIDGFNFYYGACKKTKLKWVDFESLIKKITPQYKILKIRYFTALVQKPSNRIRQEFYLKAIATNDKTSIYKGFFQQDHTRHKPIEKCSDVTLPTYMIRDACKENYDCALLISNDSDFKEPVKLVKTEFNKEVIVLNPRSKGGINIELFKLKKEYNIKLRSLRGNTLKSSQLPNSVILSNGKEIKKSDTW